MQITAVLMVHSNS